MSPLGEKILKKEAKKEVQMTWTGLSRLCLSFHTAVLAFQFGQGTNSAPKLKCRICTSRSSPEYSVLACMLVYIKCTMLAGCNQALKLFGSMPRNRTVQPPAPSPKVKSLAPMHARTKAPVKYHPVRRYMPAMHVHAHQTNYARTSLIRS